jgi:SpoVK/Ycf46/Vps4 family AAA+-type ATPase
MGERDFAKRLLQLLRSESSRRGKVAEAVLNWAEDYADWLWPDRILLAGEAQGPGDRLDWDSLPGLLDAVAADEAQPELLRTAHAVAALIELEPFDQALVEWVTATLRLPRLATLWWKLGSAGEDMLALAGRLAGAPAGEAAARVRRSAALRFGLLYVDTDGGGSGPEAAIDWRFGRVLDQALTDPDALTDALAGVRQQATLAPEDFAQHADAVGLMIRLLEGARAKNAAGVNILIHGPPGTGKTELARTLAAAARGALYAVGECDADGDEMRRRERVAALRRAQRLLARRSDSLILFDEMEDLFSEASFSLGGSGLRAGSKIYVNRLLEANEVPTIWTSNEIGDIDPAHLRRMSFILKMDHPPASVRARIAARAAVSEGVADAVVGLAPLLAKEAESASIARTALRTASIAGGGAEAAGAAARALLEGLRGGRRMAPAGGEAELDLSLYRSEPDVPTLVAQVTASGAPADFSLLLTGPPGTGKTALAAHLAERLDRPLAVKRASDLVSKWLGETEANIAAAFAQAREQGAVLLFDEADSLLLDRQDAQRSWEITQVNELLTWMDSHPLPFIAATNFPRRLDPAALRRFVFKAELKALDGDVAARAFKRFFGAPAPAALGEVAGLTPGDFAVVARQLRYRGEAAPREIVALLAAEARAKPERPCRIGF